MLHIHISSRKKLMQLSSFLSVNSRICKKKFTIKLFKYSHYTQHSFLFFLFFISGGKNCTNKKKHRTFPTVAVSVVLSCFTALSGLFLIFYVGLHYYVTKKKPIASFWTTIVGLTFWSISFKLYTIMKIMRSFTYILLLGPINS